MLDIEYTKEMLYNPEYNIKIGLSYFDNLLEQFNENYILAFAAYNAGMGNVKTWIEEGTIKNDGSDYENIPFPETNMYVRKIVRNYKNNGKKNQICDYVTSYIIRNYQDNISNVQIAKMLNLDSGYLNKVFKASTGKTIHKALIEQRINAASKMLLTTNVSLEKIAYETGFYNLAHFSSLFKKMTGHSPSYYRKGK